MEPDIEPVKLMHKLAVANNATGPFEEADCRVVSLLAPKKKMKKNKLLRSVFPETDFYGTSLLRLF